MGGILIAFPWRHFASNVLDAVVSLSLLSIALISVYYAERDEDSDSSLDKILVLFTFIPVLAVTCWVVYLLYVFLSNPRIEIKESITAALKIEGLLAQLATRGTHQLVHGLVNVTRVDRVNIIAALSLIMSESLRKQTPSMPRLIQREAAYDLPDRKNSRARDLTVQDVAAHHSELRAYAHNCKDLNGEVRRVFSQANDLPKARFIEQISAGPGANKEMAEYTAELMDTYEHGFVSREVFQAFMQEMGKAADGVDMTGLVAALHGIAPSNNKEEVKQSPPAPGPAVVLI